MRLQYLLYKLKPTKREVVKPAETKSTFGCNTDTESPIFEEVL